MVRREKRRKKSKKITFLSFWHRICCIKAETNSYGHEKDILYCAIGPGRGRSGVGMREEKQSVVSSQQSEVSSQQSEVSGQQSVVSGQQSEISSQQSERVDDLGDGLDAGVDTRSGSARGRQGSAQFMGRTAGA